MEAARAVRLRLAIPALGAILALGLCLRLHDLGRKSLWVNELWAVFEMQKPFGTMMREMDFRQPPLYFLYCHPWHRLAGDDAFLLRLPSAMLGTLTIWLVYLLGSRLFARTEGLLAALFLAVSPDHVDLSQDMRQYALWVMLSVCASILFLRALDLPSRRNLGLYLLCALLVCYTQYFGLALILAHALFYAAARARPGGARAGPLLAGVWIPFLLLMIPALLLIRCSPDQNAPGAPAGHVPLPSFRTFLSFANEMTTGWSLWGLGRRVLVLQLAVIACGIAGLSPRCGRGVLFLCVLYAGMFALIFAMLYAMNATPARRYFFILIPVCVLLFAGGAARPGRWLAALLRAGGRRLPQAFPAMLGACLAVIPLSALGRFYGLERQDLAGAARVLKDGAAVSDCILLRQVWADEYLAYYHPGLRGRSICFAADLPALERAAAENADRRIWVTYVNTSEMMPGEKEWLERRGRLVYAVPGRELPTAIWVLDPPPPPGGRGLRDRLRGLF